MILDFLLVIITSKWLILLDKRSAFLLALDTFSCSCLISSHGVLYNTVKKPGRQHSHSITDSFQRSSSGVLLFDQIKLVAVEVFEDDDLAVRLVPRLLAKLDFDAFEAFHLNTK